MKYYSEHKKATENLNNINEYWNLTMKAFFLKKIQGNIRDKNELKKFNEIIKLPLLQSEDLWTNGFHHAI